MFKDLKQLSVGLRRVRTHWYSTSESPPPIPTLLFKWRLVFLIPDHFALIGRAVWLYFQFTRSFPCVSLSRTSVGLCEALLHWQKWEWNTTIWSDKSQGGAVLEQITAPARKTKAFFSHDLSGDHVIQPECEWWLSSLSVKLLVKLPHNAKWKVETIGICFHWKPAKATLRLYSRQPTRS